MRFHAFLYSAARADQEDVLPKFVSEHRLFNIRPLFMAEEELQLSPIPSVSGDQENLNQLPRIPLIYLAN
jgi:hypothetical protein